ncbi:hypothetical protein OEZ85_013714 [Tetradesmus obliquus]|uniref:NAD(P)-binding domain-containing protein n=1 Tax=Tetradesmus obliquus TaxID=3088 RepID=A0ABY8USA4_TETOB|nr:hypothetical protein OEZ85_013714 [Tetradesmus obliquus]
MSALVLGGTGAVGHHIVQQLLASDQWSKVITVGRREVPLPADQPGASKLQQVVVNMDALQREAADIFSGFAVVVNMDALQREAAGIVSNVVVNMDALQSEAAGSFAGVDAVFCALGTTRADAGSADGFRKVDHDYVAAAAAAAKAAGVPYFGLVSAQGAAAGVPSSDWRLLHPLLYTRTKGLAEEAVKGQGFARVGIFRPGMLDRGDKARSIEKLFAPLTGAIAVSDVARVMLADAAAFKAGSVAGVGVFEMKDMRAAAAAAK